MAIEGSTIISQHILDDEPLRAGLTANENMIRASSARMSKALTIDTHIAHRSLAALNSLVVVFGGSTSIMGLEIGRAAIMLLRLGNTMSASSASTIGATASTTTYTTATLASANAQMVLARAMMATATTRTAELSAIALYNSALGTSIVSSTAYADALTKINFTAGIAVVGIIALGAAAGLAAVEVVNHFDEIIAAADRLRDRVGKSLAEALFPSDTNTSKQKKQMGRITALFGAQQKLEDRRAASDIQRRIEFGEIPPEFAEKDPQIRSDLEQIRRNKEAKLRTERDQSERDKQAAKGWALVQSRDRAFESVAVQFGGFKPSRFIDDPQMKKYAQFREMAEERLKAAGEASAGFGISTRDAGAFRFGTGAAGSVIGEQNEQKNTTQAIKDAMKLIERLFQQAFGSPDSDLGWPGIGAMGP